MKIKIGMGKNETNKHLTAGELHYCEIFEKAIDGICILDKKSGIILNANNKASEITGYNMEQLVGRQFSDLITLNGSYSKIEVDKKILLTVKIGPQQFEWELKHKDGNIHWAEVHFTIAKIGGIERIIGFFKLIDARKRAEISLQTSEANLRTILNHTDVAFILLNKEYGILSWNKQASRWSLLALGKKLKENTNLISLIDGDFQSEIVAKLKKAINGHHIDYETQYALKNGGEDWYRIRMNPVRNGDESVIGICLSAINITYIKNSELESQKLTRDLIQQNKDLEQFAYIVSHNLRAPIANIIGLSEQLRKTELQGSKEKQFTSDLYATVKQLDNVIKDLNHILQIKHELNEIKRVVSFSEIITEIQKSIDQLIRTNDVKITYDFSKVDRMMTLKSYLYSIFYNLIINGIKYRKEKVQPLLEISSRVNGQKLEIVFRDNGLGIDLGKGGEQLFGLYKRFHSHVEGKGMGLYMVKLQVESLGGSISVTSEVNVGTEFRIEFPYQQIQKHLLNRQYVVIDDDYINNIICEQVIKSVYPDAKVYTFSDPSVALEFIGSPAWSMAESTIILLDINMPNITGWEFLEIFKQLDNNIKQSCEIYMISSSIDQRDKIRASENPLVSDFIEKPLNEEWIYRI